MVGAKAAADLIDPRIYHVAQETYRARLAELGAEGHASALNAAVDAVAADLIRSGWMVGGEPGQGKGSALWSLLAGGEAA